MAAMERKSRSGGYGWNGTVAATAWWCLGWCWSPVQVDMGGTEGRNGGCHGVVVSRLALEERNGTERWLVRRVDGSASGLYWWIWVDRRNGTVAGRYDLVVS